MKKRTYIIMTVVVILLVCVLFFFVKCGGAKAIKSIPIIKPAPTAQEPGKDYIINASQKPQSGARNYGIWVVKTGPNGAVQWEKIFRGKYYEWADLILPVNDGGYIIASKTYSFGEDYDGVFLMKIDAKGNSLWTKKFDGSGDKEFSEPLANGSLVAGRTYSDDNKSYGVFLAKADLKGDYSYIKTFGSDYLSWGYTAVSTKDGHFVTTGAAEEYRNDDDTDIYLLQRDKKGGYSWARKFGGDKYDWGYSVAPAKDGGYLVAGLTYSGGAGEDDMYVIKTDADGNSLWARTYGGPGADRAYDAEQSQDNGYIIAGVTSSFGSGGYDAYLVKTDADGNTEWARTYGGAGDESAHSIAATKDGGYIFAGASNSN